MPVRKAGEYGTTYYLVSFDKDGRERSDGGILLSVAIAELLRERSFTDVFLVSHGWKGDIPAAIKQYDRWFAQMAALGEDRAAARARPQGFRPLVVGLHWPSLPWGDERMPRPAGLLGEDTGSVGHWTLGRPRDLIDEYAATIADTPQARTALTAVASAVRQSPSSSQITPALRDAYMTLYVESGLDRLGTDDRLDVCLDGFDPDVIVAESANIGEPASAAAVSGLLGCGPEDRAKDLLLMPVRQLSFWKMKERGRRVGESGVRDLLRTLQSAASCARFHLMGHSFGCIVVSAAVTGPSESVPLPRPVDSLFLVQGAMSLWSACPDVPYAAGTAGYFHRLVADNLVSGPIVTTRSKHDFAIGRFYPLGARVKRQLLLDPQMLPPFGGVGSFGLQGLGLGARDMPIQSSTFAYRFDPHVVYNVDASRVIATLDGVVGAHSDIVHDEIAHIQWEAMLASR